MPDFAGIKKWGKEGQGRLFFKLRAAMRNLL